MYFQDLFLSVLNMSITTSYVILAVLLLRLALKGMPKKYSYALWSVVGFRLVCPVSFKSIFSLFSLKPFDMTKAQQMNEYSLTYVKPEKAILRNELTTGVSAVNSVIENQVVPSDTFQSSYSVIILALEFLWVAGIAALLIYSAVKFIKLKKSLSTSILIEKGVYQSENISSPFIVGIICPKIYVPSGIDEGYMQYVLAHERYHIKRFDNGVKLISYFLLVLHWFNPLVWLAFYLMTKDMEMSCDEAVISKNPDIKKTYSTALLSFATNKRFPVPSPISFSENGVKARIKNVLHYRKPKKLLQAVAIILCLALLTACAANPKLTVTETDITNAVESITGNIKSDVYTAGKTVGANMSLSLVRENGYYYDKITIKKDSLKIIDNLGNEIFESEKAEETPLDIEDKDGIVQVEFDNRVPITIYEDYGYLFRHGDYTCVTYTNSKMTKEGTVTYKVYFNNGEPFAFCDMRWVYYLEPEDMDKLVSNAITKNEKDRYAKGDYFGEAHRILDVKYADRSEKEVIVYLYANVAWLSAEDGNELGRRLVNTSGGAGPVAIVFDKNGKEYKLKKYTSLNENYHSQDAKELLSEQAYKEFEKLKTEDLTYLDKELYKQIAEKYLPDTNEFITTAFYEWDNTDNTFEDKQTLLNFGDYTIKYCFSRFIDGDDGTELETKYSLILQELLYNEAAGVEGENGRVYFNNLVDYYKIVLKDFTSPEDMQSSAPYGYLLLEMTGSLKQEAAVSESRAEKLAFLQLKEDYESKADGFVLESVTLYQANEGRFKITANYNGNPYYEVMYTDTNNPAYHVYYFVDSLTGEVIWTNTISD